jgi:heat shock protein HtpX
MSTNSLKTVLLLGTLSGLVVVAGNLVGGRGGMMIGLLLAVGMNFFSYFFSEKMALASSGAIRTSPTEHPQIYNRIAPMTERLCQRMGLPMPKLWVLNEASPNAFATGRNPANSSVAVSAGLLEIMDDREVEAVIAHELGHIKHRDILTSSIAATLGAAITSIAHMAYFFGGRSSDDDEGVSPMGALAMMLLAPMAASVVQMAVSRTREFSADAAAAKYTGSPEGLINALSKLERASQRIPMEASPAMSHMYIIPTLNKQWFAKLFSTHPPTQERIAKLQSYRGSVAEIPV